MSEGEVAVEVAEVPPERRADVDDQKVARAEDAVGRAHVDLVVAGRAGNRHQIRHRLRAKLDQQAVEQPVHVALALPRTQPRAELPERLAGNPGDPPHAVDLLRALPHAYPLEGDAPVDNLDAGQPG